MSNKKNTHLSHRQRLELGMTAAWETEAKWLPLLRPLSKTYQFISDHKKNHYASGKKSAYHAPVPVLVIGNITVGGSGKTPLLIALVAYFLEKGVPVGVISRGYGGDERAMPALVKTDSLPAVVGDEPCLIVQSLAAMGKNVPMAVAPKRQHAIELLLKQHPDVALIISDDGLQHYAMHRDVEWIVVDVARGFGNGKLLPEGFLREPIDRLEGATVIYHDARAERYADDALLMHLAPSAPIPLLGGNKTLSPQRVYGVSGIGYPARFFKTLTDLGFTVVEKPFGDHHDFVLDELTDLADLPIIITSKDAVKIRELAKRSPHVIFDNVWILPIQAVLSEGVYGEMDRVLGELGVV